MDRRINAATGWLRKRWLLLSLVSMVTAVLLSVAPMVLHLPQYPAHQAALFHQSIEKSRDVLPPKDRLALEKDLLLYETDNRIKIWTAIVQALAGVALLVGLLFTWRNLRATQLKLDIDREAQLTNRFTQATTQLGAQLSDGRPNVEARLGGIYALAWIARDSLDDYWPVVEILTAYVRHNAAWPRPEPGISSLGGTPYVPKVGTDIQAILTVLGRSTPPKVTDPRLDQKFDLRVTDLRGAEFWDAHLEKADFWGAHLEGAQLWGAYLNDAKLVNAHLRGANLKKAIFAGADLTGADLDGADLEGTDLRNATGLTRKQVESAQRRGRDALLPPGFSDGP
ncbi:MAG TPA: pentapeptide repeat-containing protein [Ktedonobacterales bacterium]|nr:pentapeptide repeat-containing protein [Ktedonobacterales bacterium]